MLKRFTTLVALATLHLQVTAQATKINDAEGLMYLATLSDNQALFISSKTSYLWTSDGTANGTRELTDKVVVGVGGKFFKGKYYFEGYDAEHGLELWETDGTVAGTKLLKDINPGPASSDPGDGLVIMGDKLFFSAVTNNNGREPWLTDGSFAGTRMIKDVLAGQASSNDRALFKFFATNSLVYFVAAMPGIGEELWRTDGTAAGTFLVKDINPNERSSVPMLRTVYQNKMVFIADDGTHGEELWMSDGTTAGTQMIKDIRPGETGSLVDHVLVINNKLVFPAMGPTGGYELWESDGTAAGTKLLKDINPGETGSNPSMFNGVYAHGGYHFTAYTENEGLEPWFTDGTPGGTRIVKDIEPGPWDSYPFFYTPHANNDREPTNQLFQGNKFFLTCYTMAQGLELYISDGTQGGTRLVKDVNPGWDDGETGGGYFYTKNFIYYRGLTNNKGAELWRSDGTAAGTTEVADIYTGFDNSDASPIALVGGKLLFSAYDAANVGTPYTHLYATTGADQVLPVRLQQFSGSAQNRGNQLVWKVASATGFSHFELERSLDGGSSYVRIATIQKSASPAQTDYQYLDTDITATRSLYRLRMVDDGSARYSSIVDINRNALATVSLKAFAAAGNTITVNYRQPGQNAVITLIDVQGRRLSQLKVGQQGVAHLAVPAGTSGLVIVALSDEQGIMASQKIMIQ